MRQSLGALCVLTTLAAILLAPAWLNDRVLYPRDARSVAPWSFHGSDELAASLATEPVNDELTDKNVFDFPKLALGHLLWDADGKVPLWNPHTFCGNPLLATAMPSQTYPPNWLGMLFPYRADTWIALAHLALSGYFMFLYLGAVNIRPSAALLAGTTYAFSGWYLVHLYLPSYLYTATWFPLMLLAIERLMTRPEDGARKALGWFVVLAGAVGLAAFAGFPPVLFLSLYAAAAYALLRAPAALRIGGVDAALGRPIVCGIAVACGLALGAAQLLPTYELSKDSGRSHMSREELESGALRPLGLLGLAMPDFFGNPAADSPIKHDPDRTPSRPLAPRRIGLDGPPPPADWGNNSLENTHYVGILPLILALVALVRRRRHVTYIWLLIGAVALAFSLALGPLDRIASLAPGLQTGSLKRCLFLFTAAMSILAGIGFDGAIGGARKRWGLAAFIPVVVLAIATAWLFLFPAGLTGLLERLVPFGEAGVAAPTEVEMRDWVDNTRWCLLRLGAVLLPIAIVFLLLKRGAPARPLRFAVLLIVFADLAWLGLRFNPTHRPDQTSTTPGIEFLQRNTRDLKHATPLGRIARFGPEAHFVLPPNTGMLYRLYDIQGWDVLFPGRYQRFMNLIEPGIAKAHHLVGPFRQSESLASPLLDLLGVRYVLTDRDWGPTPSDGFRRAYPLANEDPNQPFVKERLEAEGLAIYENTDAMPRAWLAPRVRTVESEGAIFDAVGDSSFDPRRTVVATPGHDLPPYSDTEPPVTITDYRARRVAITVGPGGPATLVLGDAFSPSWEAFFTCGSRKGKLSIHRVNGIFRAVGLPRREARMEIVFHHPGRAFQLGARVSLGAAAILALIFVIGLFRSTKRRTTGADRPKDE